MSNTTRIYLTPPHPNACDKLGKRINVYFCAIKNKAFTTIRDANECCKNCDCGCDRGAYLRQKQWDSAGLHMKPFSPDALIKIEGYFMPLDERDKIRREIIENNGQSEI